MWNCIIFRFQGQLTLSGDNAQNPAGGHSECFRDSPIRPVASAWLRLRVTEESGISRSGGVNLSM
jgi:hypothetical protein